MKVDKDSLHLLAVFRPRMGLETLFRCLLHSLPEKLLAEIFSPDDSGLVDSGRGLGANLGASGRHRISAFNLGLVNCHLSFFNQTAKELSLNSERIAYAKGDQQTERSSDGRTEDRIN